MARTNAVVKSNTNYLKQRNYFINGNFDFWQRVGATAFGWGASTWSYSADRWAQLYSADGGTGQNFTGARVAFAAGQSEVPNAPKYYLRQTVTAPGTFGTSGQVVLARQAIEEVSILAGKTVTISFWARASAGSAQKLNVGCGQLFGSGGSAQVLLGVGGATLSTSWAKYSMTIALPSVSGKAIMNNSFTDFYIYAHQGSVQAALFNQGNAISSISLQAGTIDIAQIMLNEGSSAAPFSLAADTLTEEFAICQRYYEKSYPVDSPPGSSVTGGANYTVSLNTIDFYDLMHVKFRVEKRAQPSIAMYGLTGTAGVLYNVNQSANQGNAQVRGSSLGVAGFAVSCSNSAMSVNHAFAVQWAADAEYY